MTWDGRSLWRPLPIAPPIRLGSESILLYSSAILLHVLYYIVRDVAIECKGYGLIVSRAHNMSGLVARELSGSYVHLSRRWTCDGRSCCRRFGRCDSRGFTEEGSKG